MKKLILLAAMPAMSAGLLAMLTACEKPITPEGDDGNVHLTFIPTTHDVTTRGTVSIGDYFSRLAVQMFDADGNKVWDKVKTQSRDDDDFGTLSVGLKAGTYTVVAVGHSSPVTPTIKSTDMVQFTAKDGVKNSDTFCYYGTVTIDEDHTSHELRMNRMTAMVMFEFTDETLPESYAGVRAEYTGGSANFNPTTSEGCTKSTQSELRDKNALYFFTFPYLSDEGKLKITISALDADQNVLTTKTLTDVPVTRNRITHCQGTLFGDGDFTIYQTAFGISVNTDWDGEDYYHF
jgi:hypothetical protein